MPAEFLRCPRNYGRMQYSRGSPARHGRGNPGSMPEKNSEYGKEHRGTTMKPLLMPACLLMIFSVNAAANEPPADREKFHLFLLAGQSNMAGRGQITAEDRRPNPRILMLTKAGEWKPAVAPLHFDKKSAGVGIGREFARQIVAADPTVTVGLIPCAAGGSPISAWEPGGYHGQTNSRPYDESIRRAGTAMKTGVLKGVLWHQGESDSKPKLADVYEQKLHQLIVRLRMELSAEQIPFIAGQMGQFPERPWSDDKKKVDQAHRNLPQKVAGTAFVNSDGLSHKGDRVHFDAKSYRVLGRRYAEAFLKLTRRDR